MPFSSANWGHFASGAPERIQYAVDKFRGDSRKLLEILDKQLEGKNYIVGDEYTIADIATWPFIESMYARGGAEVLKMSELKNIVSWRNRVGQREAVQRGIKVTPRD
jgi:GST-like protein